MNVGDWVVLQDRKARKYLFRLKENGRFESQRGIIQHQTILSQGSGSRVTTASGEEYWVHQPTLEDYVLLMPREATPTYPKDAAAICSLLDLAPGKRVLEAGSGSGGLTMFLARAVGQTGEVWSFESKHRHLEQAQRNLEGFEDWGNVRWHLQDVAEASLEPASFDGIALDLMEPWLVLPKLVAALKPDRFLVTYLPNITQVVRLLEAIAPLPLMHDRTLELTQREWDIRPPVAHPHFQQVGHTAFLTRLRKTH